MARRAHRVKNKSPAARFQRVLRQPARTPGAVRTTVQSTGTFNVSTTAGTTAITYGNLQGLSDYTAFAAIYRTFRVVGMHFQLSDLQANSPCHAIAGTFHSGGSIPTITSGLVQDLPDVMNLRPYETNDWYWFPQSFNEKEFVSTGVVDNWGGLLAYFAAAGVNISPKYGYKVVFVVEWKDRL